VTFNTGKGDTAADMNKILRIKICLGVVGICVMGVNEVAGMAIAAPLTSHLKFQVQLIAQKVSQALFGLGLPKTAGTGGSVRLKDDGLESSGGKFLPILALLVPEDGAKTASDRPTVYWNMILNYPQDYKLTFFLQETAEENSKVVLEQEVTITKGGLFKFQIPQSINPNAPRRWGIKCKWPDGKIVAANGVFAFTEPNSEIKMALSAAKTDLDKARIYASNSYWYDALDAYTNWINANPQDNVAIQERGKVITEGFKDRKGLNTETFVAQINTAQIKEFK
jgi:hypothetical protein